MAIYARIQDGIVFELFETDGDITQMFHPDLIWVDVSSVTGIAYGWGAIKNDNVWSFTPYVAPLPTDAEISALNSLLLQQANHLAVAQKAALTNRVSTLNDAIKLKMATPAEEAELPVRTAQLEAWETYAVLLGRVTLQTGWALTVEWPAQPTEGMDLAVSAVAPNSPQLQ